MILQEEIEYMAEAYKKLFFIRLRIIIEENLLQEYGPHWEYTAPMKHLKRFTKPIMSSNLHELLNYFNIYPPLLKIFTKKELVILKYLPSIRNKIAHCHTINSIDNTLLDDAYLLILERKS